MRGLGLRDSIQLVTWLHGLPTTGVKDFLALIKDFPRATVIHILEGCEQIALLILVTQKHLPKRPLQGLRGNLTRKQLLLFVLIFERELFPRLTYMKNLIAHIHECSEDIPMNENIIAYDPLLDIENVSCPHRALPRQTPHNNHLRPSVKRGIFANPYAHLPGEQPCKDLGHDDLPELFRHDEERGLSKILLAQGTEIEIPIENEQGPEFGIHDRQRGLRIQKNGQASQRRHTLDQKEQKDKFRSEPGPRHYVECVMTFACPPEG